MKAFTDMEQINYEMFISARPIMGCYGCFTLFRSKVSAGEQNKSVKFCKKFSLQENDMLMARL